jgi:translation initiation factor IF-1
MAEKEEKVEFEGEIVEALRNRMFRVRLDNGHETLGYTSGKMKRFRIRMLLGDRGLRPASCCLPQFFRSSDGRPASVRPRAAEAGASAVRPPAKPRQRRLSLRPAAEIPDETEGS